MKKHFLSIAGILVLTVQVLQAQTDFKLTATSYVGALPADAGSDWTAGWTNWDPKNTNYPAPTDVTTLDGMSAALPVPGELNITGTLTLDATKVYLLKGFIVVRSGGKLVIPAGTIIRCQSDLSTTPKNYASIVVERGGRIEIDGTANNPVVITSAKAVGQRERGDWGGLLIAGRSSHNLFTQADNVQMEGFNNVSFDGTLANFGGTIPNDNSGFVRFLRVEFAGLAFEVNKEINAITLGAVGSATEIHHIQTSFSNDDSFEWFGGTVNSSHLIAFKGTDDDFDTDNGYSGLSQFGIALRDSAYYDPTYSLPSGGSTSEGFESDNEASGTANVALRTNAVFSNYTMLGPVPVGSTYNSMNSVTKAAFRRGARIRRNSSLRVVNSIFMGYRNFVMIDGDSCVRNTNYAGALALVTPNTAVNVQKNQISFANNLIVSTDAAFTSTTDTTANGLVEVARAAGSINKRNAIDAWVRQSGALANSINPVAFTTGTVLVNPLAASTTPDFRPVSGSPALSGANFLNNPVLVNLVPTQDIFTAPAAIPVYPNPIAGGALYFGRQVVSFGLFDMNGKLVKHGFDTDHVLIDGLATGVYFIQLDGKAQKVIVE
jgi:hypothetical protein